MPSFWTFCCYLHVASQSLIPLLSPFTGLSWLPYNSALAHRVVMVTLRARFLCLRLHYRSRHLAQAHLLLMSLTFNYNFFRLICIHVLRSPSIGSWGTKFKIFCKHVALDIMMPGLVVWLELHVLASIENVASWQV